MRSHPKPCLFPRRLAAYAAILLSFLATTALAKPQPLNVLFIAVDDLRPQLACYGHDEMVTPSLDRLAREGRRFVHHFVQVPTCGASRCALLTGQYPSVPGAYDNNAFAALPRSRDAAPISLPALFQQAGYTTAAIGKITHAPGGRGTDGQPELPFAWSETSMPLGIWRDPQAAFFAYAGGKTRIVDRIGRVSCGGGSLCCQRIQTRIQFCDALDWATTI